MDISLQSWSWKKQGLNYKVMCASMNFMSRANNECKRGFILVILILTFYTSST